MLVQALAEKEKVALQASQGTKRLADSRPASRRSQREKRLTSKFAQAMEDEEEYNFSEESD